MFFKYNTQLGPPYQVWIMYGRAGGERGMQLGPPSQVWIMHVQAGGEGRMQLWLHNQGGRVCRKGG